MGASQRTEIERDGHVASCRICGHTEYGESDLDALNKLGPHFQEHQSEEAAKKQKEGRVIPLRKKN